MKICLTSRGILIYLLVCVRVLVILLVIMFLYKSCNPYEWGQLINLSTLVKSYSMVARALFSKKHEKF